MSSSSNGVWKTLTITLLICGCNLLSLSGVKGHGRLIEPPSRSSMWRYGFNTTANYNDHELYCGGFARMHEKNNGKCGVCGDPWDGARPNEAGGAYAQGIIVRKYRKNSIIRIKVELTANHKGYFEFRLCPNNNPKKVVTQKCLDNHLLNQSNSEGPRYYPSPGEGTKVFESRFLLPKGMTCTQCVLQWRYTAANSWGGPCPDGRKEAVGCGPQEEFRACSDVAIYDDKGYASAEEPEDANDNEVDIDKLEGVNTTSTETPEVEVKGETAADGIIWPFIMAFIALLVAALSFGTLFGWFYRKEILQCISDSIHKLNSKRVQGGSSQPIGSDTYASQTIGGPVPPPRTKKLHNANITHPDIYGQRKQITPDVISQPMQVTINGLPV